MKQNAYIGRFAPSPTGPLHFGSLVAALASFLDARHAEGRWLLRIEDLDPPRESAEAPRIIMSQLKRFGLVWDGDVLFQSTRLEAYADALAKLSSSGHTFRCTCSRKSVENVYQGRCRHRAVKEKTPHAIRLRIDDARIITFDDAIRGSTSFDLGRDIGDFVIYRKDGLFAYQLAVVVDDAFQKITYVVRGNDLVDSTPRQIFLADILDLPHPRYAHLPVITDDTGQKLSKQRHADPVDGEHPIGVLRAALTTLSQPVPSETDLEKFLQIAVESWDIARIPRVAGIPAKYATSV